MNRTQRSIENSLMLQELMEELRERRIALGLSHVDIGEKLGYNNRWSQLNESRGASRVLTYVEYAYALDLRLEFVLVPKGFKLQYEFVPIQ